MDTVLITGGTGLVGTAITEKLLERGYKVIILSRQFRQSPNSRLQYAVWDIDKGTLDEVAIREADVVIHLAGAGVADRRWTKKRKQQIRDSRVRSGELLMRKLKEIPNHIRVVISASAIGWYGPDPSVPNSSPFTEDAPAYHDFLGTTCADWELAVSAVPQMGKRLVILRTGIVFSDKGGALAQFKKAVKGPFVPVLGSGKQIMSWIDINDLVRIYLFAIENNAVNGIYNAVAPRPESNREIMMKVAGKNKGKMLIAIPVPAILLKVVLGEMSIEVLKSATVSCERIEKAGFAFQKKEW